MSALSKATDLVNLAVEGMDLISQVIDSPTLKTADEVVHAVRAVLQAVSRAAGGEVTPDAVRAELGALSSAIAAHDAKADQDLAARFDGSDHTP